MKIFFAFIVACLVSQSELRFFEREESSEHYGRLRACSIDTQPMLNFDIIQVFSYK